MEVRLKRDIPGSAGRKYYAMGIIHNNEYRVMRTTGYGYTITVPKVGDRDVQREHFEVVTNTRSLRHDLEEGTQIPDPFDVYHGIIPPPMGGLTANQTNKADGGKSNPLLIEEDMAHALELVNRVLDYGAEKYERAGWKKVEHERYMSAMLRHQRAWLKGELLDDESGLPHIAHIACNALFLLQMYADVQITKGKYAELLKYNKPPQGHKK